MGTTGQNIVYIRVVNPVVGNVLQYSVPGSADFSLRVVSPVSGKGNYGGRDAHRYPLIYHW